jgi:MFS family permease
MTAAVEDLAASPGTAATAAATVFSGKYLPITISTLTLVALAAFDGMAVGAALPKIGGDLGVALLPWVLTAFLLTSTVAMLVAGPMIDALGIRPTFQITLAAFALGSVMCAVAPNLVWLIAARVIQGIGGGMVMAVAIANVGISYPAELRPRAFAANSTIWGTMALAGPAIVAVLMKYTGWRVIFWLNLPLVAIAALIGWPRLPKATARTKLRIDTFGLAIIAALTTAFLFGVAALKWWSWIALAVGIGLCGVYWWHSGRTAEAVLDRRYFARWPFGWLNLLPFTFFAGALAVDGYVPIFVQGGLLRSSGAAAFAVAFLAIGWTTGSQITSRLLDRFENTQVMLTGFMITLPPLVLCALIYRSDTPLYLVYALSFIQGLGIGSVTNSTLSLLQHTATPEEMGRASSAHQFLRSFGGTLGTALAGTVLLAVVQNRIGSVKPVQQLLSRKDVTISAPVQEAIVAGFRASAVVAVGFTTAGLAIAFYVHKRLQRPAIIP